ncbi:cupin domain-containing protein [Candidatus Saccharibacteria bacterium]|nr:cupin domain-containing protein [Candidatus Saccharibacteria bacterium]
MQILPKSEPNEGPTDWFTGKVVITPLKAVSDNSKLSMSSVHFEAGARAAWHSHPCGQTLFVTDGIGVVQKRGEPIQIIRPGDVIWTEPGEEHWHGATSGQSMTHLAIQEVDEQGNFADWQEHVTDEEYSQQPEVGQA